MRQDSKAGPAAFLFVLFMYSIMFFAFASDMLEMQIPFLENSVCVPGREESCKHFAEKMHKWLQNDVLLFIYTCM